MIYQLTLIYELVFADLRQKVASSILGIFWLLFQPLASVTIIWFVFEFGLKTSSIGDTPFLFWLTTGLIPWFQITETIQSGTNSIVEKPYLVKKIQFELSLLPVVRLFSVFILNLAFWIFLSALLYKYHIQLTAAAWQIFYYYFASLCLLLSIIRISSSIVVFFPDLSHIIATILQILYWGTPIFWSKDHLPERLQWILKINPFAYIVDGFRDSLINHIFFWDKPTETIIFWAITICLGLLSSLVFKSLRPHFADVL